MTPTRRNLLGAAGGLLGTAALPRGAAAQSFPFTPNQRYPDPAVEILDPSFAKYRIYSSTLEQVATGMRWAEGPVYFPEGGYLLCSDIPNNRIMKFDEKDNSLHRLPRPGQLRQRQCAGPPGPPRHLRAFRHPPHHPHGKGRLRITVLADSFEGKRLNAPNDIVVRSDDTSGSPTRSSASTANGKAPRPAGAGHHQRLPHRHGRQARRRHHRPAQPQRPRLLAGREEALRGRVAGTPNRSIWSYDINAPTAASATRPS
jgi:gluconolactonase